MAVIYRRGGRWRFKERRKMAMITGLGGIWRFKKRRKMAVLDGRRMETRGEENGD
jgi:hypothetical protein